MSLGCLVIKKCLVWLGYTNKHHHSYTHTNTHSCAHTRTHAHTHAHTHTTWSDQCPHQMLNNCMLLAVWLGLLVDQRTRTLPGWLTANPQAGWYSACLTGCVFTHIGVGSRRSTQTGSEERVSRTRDPTRSGGKR